MKNFPLPRSGVLRLAALSILMFVWTAVCAKKMLPPSPDRFAPRLEGVNTRSRVQIELVFDEPVDAASFDADSFAVFDGAGLPHQVRGVSLGRRGEYVLVWTEVLEPAWYIITGRVADHAGNVTRFRRRFWGASVVDTIVPTVRGIRPPPGSVGLRRDLMIEVTFSEPIDTTVLPFTLIVPRKFDTIFRRSWSSDWLSLSLRPYGSFVDSGVIYFILLPGVMDVSGNRCRQTVYTYFTVDSVLLAMTTVHGKVRWERDDFGSGVVFFEDEITRAIAPILSDGSFTTKVPQGRYLVRCVVDVDLDGTADFMSPSVEFSTQAESLELVPMPAPTPIRIDADCR